MSSVDLFLDVDDFAGNGVDVHLEKTAVGGEDLHLVDPAPVVGLDLGLDGASAELRLDAREAKRKL
jgi:hypothetical protein